MAESGAPREYANRYLRDICLPAETAVASRYYYVPIWRIALFSMLTVSLYDVYWFYKNWAAIKRADGSDIWPIARATFCPFTYFSLASDINGRSMLTEDEKPRLVPAVAPLAFFVVSAFGRYFEIAALARWVAILPAALRIRDLVPPTERARGEKLSIRHALALALLGGLWILALLGLFLGDSDLPR